MRLLQIVPMRTTAPDGIGDYAVRLSEKLLADHGVATAFVAGTPATGKEILNDDWPTQWVEQRRSVAFERALAAIEKSCGYDAVVLHVAGYGYDRRGSPIWLARGIQRWRRAHPLVPLIGIFHELYATGKPWHSSFWLGSLQRHIARMFWRMCDSGITNTEAYFDELIQWRSSRPGPLFLMPVVSNVGEPPSLPEFSSRKQRAVVFGRAGVERNVYELNAPAVEGILAEFAISEVIDIGPRKSTVPDRIGRARVLGLGQLPASEVGAHLLDCRIGFLAYDVGRLGKSTIFSAYAAHGVVPICLGSQTSPREGLHAGHHLVRSSEDRVEVEGLGQMSAAVRAWYTQHDLHSLSRCVATLMKVRPAGKSAKATD